MIEAMADAVSGQGAPEMPHPGRHRPTTPLEPAGSPSLAAADVEARLLGERRSMGRRDVSAKASVSLRSAQKFWHALGFPNVGEIGRAHV